MLGLVPSAKDTTDLASSILTDHRPPARASIMGDHASLDARTALQVRIVFIHERYRRLLCH